MVSLREAGPGDLPVLFEHQLDPEGAQALSTVET